MGNSSSRHAAFPDLEERYRDIQDPNLLRRLVLQDIDQRPFGQSHIRAILVAGTGFLTDSYDIFAINLVSDMIGFCYFPHNGNQMPQVNDTLIKTMASVGTLVGQLFFGWLADHAGRKRMYGYELLIISLATLGQCITGPSSAVSITGLLIFWRLIMGLGIGGDYPLANIITSEFALSKSRGTMVAAVFSTQALGQLSASLVTYIVTEAFRNQTDNSANLCQGDQCTQTAQGHLAVDRMWRIIIGFGAIPAVTAMYFRFTIPETPRYTFDISRDVEQGFADYQAFCRRSIGPMKGRGQVSQAREGNQSQLNSQSDGGLNERVIPKSSWEDFKRYFGTRRNFLWLFGTCTSWFFLDVVYYALALNNTIFLQEMGFGSILRSENHTIFAILRNGAIGNLILVAAGAIPGCLLAVYFVDKIGRKPIQIGGFAAMTILLLILGSAFESMNGSSRVALFVLILFFINFGPNSTTFIVPGECFPTRYRSTAHGMAAASGKLGAVLAQSLTGPLRELGFQKGKTEASPWLPHVIQILGAFSFLGMLASFLIPETMGKSLEELAGEEPIEGGKTINTPWLQRLWRCSRPEMNSRPDEGSNRLAANETGLGLTEVDLGYTIGERPARRVMRDEIERVPS